jgi:hypothetical protein
MFVLKEKLVSKEMLVLKEMLVKDTDKVQGLSDFLSLVMTKMILQENGVAFIENICGVITSLSQHEAATLAAKQALLKKIIDALKDISQDQDLFTAWEALCKTHREFLIGGIDLIIKQAVPVGFVRPKAEDVLNIISTKKGLEKGIEMMDALSDRRPGILISAIWNNSNMLKFIVEAIYNTVVQAFYNYTPGWIKNWLIGEEINTTLRNIPQREQDDRTRFDLNEHVYGTAEKKTGMAKALLLKCDLSDQYIDNALPKYCMLKGFNFSRATFAAGLNLEQAYVTNCNFTNIKVTEDQKVNLKGAVIDLASLATLVPMINNHLVDGLETITIRTSHSSKLSKDQVLKQINEGLRDNIPALTTESAALVH